MGKVLNFNSPNMALDKRLRLYLERDIPFCVKKVWKDSKGNTEGIWVKATDVDFNNKLVTGFIDNSPVIMKDLKWGTACYIQFDEIEGIMEGK